MWEVNCSSELKDYRQKCPSQHLNIEWNEQKIIPGVSLLMWEGLPAKKIPPEHSFLICGL